MSLKDRISSPLEAGTSILDAHYLPPHLGPALEHISRSLSRKSMHVTLVVVRRDYQVPQVLPPLGSPGLSTLSTPATPNSPRGRFNFTSSTPVNALKQLVRASSYRSLVSTRSFDSHRKGSETTPAHVPSAIETPSPRLRWPLTPSTPLSPPPMTPCTTVSSVTTDHAQMSLAESFGMRLVYADDLRPAAEKTIVSTLSKAAQKFGLGNDWLSPPASPTAYGLTKHLVHSSIAQNEVLFASEGLTLVSLDRLYSLKSALSSYSKTNSPMRLEDAVDELRRLVLANNGSKVTRSDLLRSYDWLSISSQAISDLDRMYRRAYGGPEQVGAISGMSTFAERLPREPSIWSEDDDSFEDEEKHEIFNIGIAVPIGKTPSPRLPQLTIQTNFDAKPKEAAQQDDEDEDEDSERTARPTDHQVPIMFQPWNTTSIDQILSADVLSPARSSMRMGPMTPNVSDDISPTTQGEWGFLMVDDAFQGGRTVQVETF